MLIVNKDRLFLENVGAVKELSKVKFKIGIKASRSEYVGDLSSL